MSSLLFEKLVSSKECLRNTHMCEQSGTLSTFTVMCNTGPNLQANHQLPSTGHNSFPLLSVFFIKF